MSSNFPLYNLKASSTSDSSGQGFKTQKLLTAHAPAFEVTTTSALLNEIHRPLEHVTYPSSNI